MLSLFLHKKPKTAQYFLSVSSVCLITGIGFLLQNIIGYRAIALLLLLTVSLLSIFLDILPVLLAAVLSALIWDFFFIPPHFTFAIFAPEDLLMLLMYFVIALINAVLTNKIRKAEKEVFEKREKDKTIALYNTLLNSLSHELRTPIATIIGATDNLMVNGIKLSEENKKDLTNEVSKAALRLNQQVENLLNMSRLESGVIAPKKDWCDINELVYSVVAKLGSHLDHNFKISIADGLPLFKIDFVLIEQALYNIFSNAVLYTPPGTPVLIDVHTADHIIEDKGQMSKVQTDLVFVITDNGKGFPPQEIEKVFDKFYRVQNSIKGGTGLGLSISKGFVEAHGGTIRLRNWEGGGAEFTITIPAEASYINALKNE